jgi:CDP-diacylglycerol--serine O-phosphatidyltransferase
MPEYQEYIFHLLLIALIADVGDGLLARLLKVHSELGKQLDSLADMVTFGVLPGMMMFTLLLSVTNNLLISISGFLITLFSALRLAKFNIDIRQSDGFIGLPSPASTCLIFGIYGTIQYDWSAAATWWASLPVLVFITLLDAYLLVAEIPMFSFKFKKWTWAGNEFQWTFLVLMLVGLGVWGKVCIPFLVLLYIMMSILKDWTKKGLISE